MNKTNEKVKHNNIIVNPPVLGEKPGSIRQKVEMTVPNAVAAPVKKKRTLVKSNLSASNLNVRKSPNGPILCMLTPNMECELLSDSLRKEWAKIKVKDNSAIGYVMTRYLKVIKEEVE